MQATIAPDQLPLMPWPASVVLHEGRCHWDGLPLIKAPAGPLQDAAERFRKALGQTTLITTDDPNASLTLAVDDVAGSLPLPDQDETYHLSITADGVTITARHWRGALHGLTSLVQMARRDGGISLPLCEITDQPRFKWRGIKLDSVRHFITVPTIKRILDGMAHAKLNVLHWGLSNDQGVRVESKLRPNLHKRASNGDYFSQADITDLVAYAAARGIRVVPEFNMPGHATGFITAYPDLAVTPPNGLCQTYGVFDGEFDPNSDAAFAFVQDLLDEFGPLFPDPVWHFGGDEVTGKTWEAAAITDAENDKAQVQGRFTDKLAAQIKQAGKTPMGWEEIVHGNPYPDGLILETWLDTPEADANRPYQTVSATSFYLDHFLTAADHYRIDPGTSPNILGGEAAVWTEAMFDETVETYIWPRAAAIAERLWSDAAVTDEAHMYRRLGLFDARLRRLGSPHHQARQAVLTRACGGNAPDALATLAGLLSPIAYYFIRWDGYGTDTPCNDLVQGLDSDPPAARAFAREVDRLIATGEGLGNVEACLNDWATLPQRLESLFTEDGALHFYKPVLDGVGELARLGLAVLGDRVPKHADDILARTRPLVGNDNSIMGLMTALLPAISDEARPLPLKRINIRIHEPIEKLVTHTRTKID